MIGNFHIAKIYAISFWNFEIGPGAQTLGPKGSNVYFRIMTLYPFTVFGFGFNFLIEWLSMKCKCTISIWNFDRVPTLVNFPKVSKIVIFEYFDMKSSTFHIMLAYIIVADESPGSVKYLLDSNYSKFSERLTDWHF